MLFPLFNPFCFNPNNIFITKRKLIKIFFQTNPVYYLPNAEKLAVNGIKLSPLLTREP